MATPDDAVYEYTVVCEETAYCRLISTYTVLATSKDEAYDKAGRHEIIGCIHRQYDGHIQSDSIIPIDIADSTQPYHEIDHDVST